MDIDAALARLLDEGRARAARVDAHHAVLWEALAAATDGGKKFRPALVVSTHDALGGVRQDAAVRVGAATELLHTAFVIHDDVIDGDHLRRGRPNVSGTFRASAAGHGASPHDVELYGLTAGILAGDLALTAAIRAVATCGAPPEVTDELLDLFDAALHTTAAGELADVRLSMQLVQAAVQDSLTMEEHKTSAYSFALPLQAGAVLAGAGRDVTARLSEVGRSMGIAFQLVDDLIGVFGDPELSGKSVTSDLRTRKQTPLLVHSRYTAEWEVIRTFVGRDLGAEELQEVRDLLTASGSRQFVEQLAEEHLATARSLADGLGISIDLLDRMTTTPAALASGREAAA